MSRALRVRHLAAGNLYGGVERIVAECAASRRHCPGMVPSFAVAFDGRLARELEGAGLACERLGAVRVSRPWTVRRYRRALGRLFAADLPDAVICHSAWVYALAAPVVRTTGASLALWVHDRVAGRAWTERWARRTRPDAIVCNSAFTRASVTSMYPAGPPAEVLYAPVSPGEQARGGGRDRIRGAHGVDGTTPVILIAARFETWKGHRDLLTAAARIPEPWHIWIAGGAQKGRESAYERSLRSLAASLRIADRVRFLGERTDMPAVMRAADIHCQPNSSPEPFGLAFVEALYAGLPVVTTAIGGAVEILDPSTGILVPPGDVDALARALRTLVIDPPARQAFARAGPSRALALCDPARQLSRLASLLGAADRARVPA